MLGCVIMEEINYMVWAWIFLINSCVPWWLKLEPRTVSSSTLGIISCTHVDLPIILIPLEDGVG